jgi:ATP/maltotriose-dependent transcriptional regulator MalT
MNRPRSRLLASLEEAIRQAANPIEAQCLRAERAALLARQGQLERAQGVIDELKTQIAWQPHNALVRGWVALAEGLHDYYAVIGEGGGEHIEMAYRLAHDCGTPAGSRLRATTAAWLANLALSDDDLRRVPPLVREALDTAAPEHHAARARATLVAAFAYHFGGRSERAQPWYEASRRHAIAEGDEAHLSALMHNQAGVRSSQVRIAALFEPGRDERDLAQALMGTESIGHYDAGIGTASLGSLVPMLRAQVLTAQGRWADAQALFEANFDDAMNEGLKRMAASFLADRAWCEHHLGHGAKARALAGAAQQALAARMHLDDRMVALARLSHVHEALGDTVTAAAQRGQAQALYLQHREQQRQLIERLDAGLAGLDPRTL